MNPYQTELERLLSVFSKEDAAKCKAETMAEVAHNVVNVAIMAINRGYIEQGRKAREDEITQKVTVPDTTHSTVKAPVPMDEDPKAKPSGPCVWCNGTKRYMLPFGRGGKGPCPNCTP